MAFVWWLILLLAAPGPERHEIEPWLGRYVAGPETIAFRWEEDGLVYDHGNIPIRVDGAWHVTVPEFFVRHRVTWLPQKGAILLEESHDDSGSWRHELRLDGERLVKVSLSGGSDDGEIVVRTYEKQSP